MSGSGLSGEGKTENWIIFLIFLIHLAPGYVTIQAKKSPNQNRLTFQTALTLKRHDHNFHNFIVLFQPHSVEIYIKHNNLNVDCTGP